LFNIKNKLCDYPNQRGITIPSTPNHRQFIEDVKDYIKNNTIVEGYCDVIQDSLGDYRLKITLFFVR
jgi:hypothetical protein